MRVQGFPNYQKLLFVGYVKNGIQGNCPLGCRGTRQEWVVKFFNDYYTGEFCPLHGWVVHRTSQVYKSFEELKKSLHL